MSGPALPMLEMQGAHPRESTLYQNLIGTDVYIFKEKSLELLSEKRKIRRVTKDFCNRDLKSWDKTKQEEITFLISNLSST